MNDNLFTILNDTAFCREAIEIIVANLLDVNYTTASDPHTAIKIAVIQHLMERNTVLETELKSTYAVIKNLGRIL